MNIWIIEADEHIQIGLKWLIQGSCVKVDEVTMSSSFHGFLPKGMIIDLIIIDLKILQGELKTAFFNLVKDQQIPWIALSEKWERREIKVAFRHGAGDIIKKPIETNELLDAIQYTMVDQTIHLTSRSRDLYMTPRSMAVCRPVDPPSYEQFGLFISDYQFSSYVNVERCDDEWALSFYSASLYECIQEMSTLLYQWKMKEKGPLNIAVTNDGTRSPHMMKQECKSGLKRAFFHGFDEVHVHLGEQLYSLPSLVSQNQLEEWRQLLVEGEVQRIVQFIRQYYKPWNAPYIEPKSVRIHLSQLFADGRAFMDDEDSTWSVYERLIKSVWTAPMLDEIIEELVAWVQTLRSKLGDTLEQAIKYIEDQYANPDLKLQDIAKHIQRNPSYVSQLFVKKLGKNFRRILTEVRINKAKKQILSTEDNMKKVALNTGFSSAGYFAKLFKENVGVSPTEYRSTVQKETTVDLLTDIKNE
ncbi:helix-turn-helix domain-containing protein [Bacillaceae bacterium SIJ1]|uniref:helix-turn-helix domain-containing protein n=1 Tax=Litoribacterium kuwaitense TaxID=1398745 RepID=UPI0013EE0979|nr:helix-turn-helix domain-containing protein [Litoribacterium kuwaitense]NGP45410.1 helix-turn-helix domain-containing protein [Litoribacterium kuwaitense]